MNVAVAIAAAVAYRSGPCTRRTAERPPPPSANAATIAPTRTTIAAAREHGLGVGVAFNPATDPAAVAKVAGDADIVLCMSIHPGYGGQEFMPEAVDRIAALRQALPDEIHIQVDGGIDNDNVRSVYDAGATLIVAGTSIFAREDLQRSYRRLVQALA